MIKPACRHGRRVLHFLGGMNQCTQCVGWRRRDRGRVLKERGTLSLMTFGTFGHAKVRERKSIFMNFSRCRENQAMRRQHTCFACVLIPPVSATPSNVLRALLNSPKTLAAQGLYCEWRQILQVECRARIGIECRFAEIPCKNFHHGL